MYCCWSCETVKVMKLEHLGWDDVCSLSEVSESDPDMLEISPGVKKDQINTIRGWFIAKLNRITLYFRVYASVLRLITNLWYYHTVHAVVLHIGIMKVCPKISPHSQHNIYVTPRQDWLGIAKAQKFFQTSHKLFHEVDIKFKKKNS